MHMAHALQRFLARSCQGDALLHEHGVAPACVPGLWDGSATKPGEMLKDVGSHNFAQAGG
jgi:hypothetical protein